MNVLDDINKELLTLNQKRTKILEEQEAKVMFDLKSLEWTKDCDARLDITGFECAGLPRYRIFVNGPIPKISYTSFIDIFGDNPLYEYNMVFCYSSYGLDRSPNFYTSCSKRLIEFLDKVKFKSLEYRKDHLDILQTAKRNSQ